jgi:hypothetical protein
MRKERSSSQQRTGAAAQLAHCACRPPAPPMPVFARRARDSAALAAALVALSIADAGAAAVVPGAPIIGGSGKWRYQWRPDLLQLPPGTEIQDAHGLEVDDHHNIYLTYANWHTHTSTKDGNGTDQNCLIRWDPDGKNGQFMTKGGPQLCSGKPHGLKLSNEGGKMFLYHSNVAESTHSRSGKLSKTTLEGEVVWQINGTFGQENQSNYRPCWWGVPPTGNYVYLADGYGSSNVYPFTRDGKWTGKTFGGRGKEHGKFETCHGITFDPRVGQLAVSDRENHRIEFFNFDESTGDKFEYSSTVTMAGIERPCNFRIIRDPTHPDLQGMVVVAALEGPVAVLDKHNALLSVIKVSQLIGAPRVPPSVRAGVVSVSLQSAVAAQLICWLGKQASKQGASIHTTRSSCPTAILWSAHGILAPSAIGRDWLRREHHNNQLGLDCRRCHMTLHGIMSEFQSPTSGF